MSKPSSSPQIEVNPFHSNLSPSSQTSSMASSRITNPQSATLHPQLKVTHSQSGFRHVTGLPTISPKAQARQLQKTEAKAFQTRQSQLAAGYERSNVENVIAPTSSKQAIGFRDRYVDEEPKWVDLRDFSQAVPLPLGAWGKLTDEGEFNEEAKRDLSMIEEEENRLKGEAIKLQERKHLIQRKSCLGSSWTVTSLLKGYGAEVQVRPVEEKQKRLKEAAEDGMVGPARVGQAFSSRHDFKEQGSMPAGSPLETLSSRPREESFLSCSYRMNRERLSLHESAPGSRWPQRLSAQRNCGFAGGVRRGLRRDAVNEEEERDLGRSPRRVRRRHVVAVPQGLQDAMRRRTRKDNEEELDGQGSEDDDEEYFSTEEDEHWSDGQTSELDT